MRVININLDDITTESLYLGYAGEKNHVKVIIHCASFFRAYPDAVASMVAKPPVGDIYPVVLGIENKALIWEVSEADIAYSGSGDFQITFMQGEEVIKTAIGHYSISSSMTATGDPPTPMENWLEEAQEVLADLSGFDEIATGATSSDIGKALSPKTVENGKVTEWQYISGGGGGGGGTDDYSDLTNKPQINGTTLSGNKSLEDLGIINIEVVRI